MNTQDFSDCCNASIRADEDGEYCKACYEYCSSHEVCVDSSGNVIEEEAS